MNFEEEIKNFNAEQLQALLRLAYYTLQDLREEGKARPTNPNFLNLLYQIKTIQNAQEGLTHF